jgi:hypothetical protein
MILGFFFDIIDHFLQCFAKKNHLSIVYQKDHDWMAAGPAR